MRQHMPIAEALFAIALSLAAPSTVSGALPRPVPSHEQSPARPQADEAFIGSETCAACHDAAAAGLSRTAHARLANPRTPMSGAGCETCHGPGAAHAEAGGDITRINVFPAMEPRVASRICTNCHNRGEHALFEGSMHDSRNISCVKCHSIHSPQSERAQLTASTQMNLCSQCHRPQAVKLLRTSHMPLREGKMECTSCHNPHGSTNLRMLRTGNYINESCVSCHTEKRGPFLFEHPPGRESCVTCHDPHGSSNERLLVAKVPMLCQRCHIGTNHPSTLYDARSLNHARLFGRSCVQCHENIHGSNSPSGATFHR